MKYYLGLDVGGSKVAYGIANENKEIIAKTAIKTNHNYDEMVVTMAETALGFLAEQNIDLADVVSVGVGLPGVIDYHTNRLVMATNLGWFDKDVPGDMKKILGKDVFVANDADAATLGEQLAGAAKGYNSATMLTLGTGVGGGVIYNGKIFGGGDGGGLEIGHLTLVAGGLECSCTNKGCLEMYASTTALLRMAREHATSDSEIYALCGGDLSKIDGRLLFQAVDSGDEAALATLAQYQEYLVAACYTAIMAYRPEVLVIGGGISARGDLLIAPVQTRLQEKLERWGTIAKTPVVAAALGNDAGILGACFLTAMEA
ncbi:MAG: ROK family protein [Eubacteriales bacterium]